MRMTRDVLGAVFFFCGEDVVGGGGGFIFGSEGMRELVF